MNWKEQKDTLGKMLDAAYTEGRASALHDVRSSLGEGKGLTAGTRDVVAIDYQENIRKAVAFVATYGKDGCQPKDLREHFGGISPEQCRKLVSLAGEWLEVRGERRGSRYYVTKKGRDIARRVKGKK